MYYIMNSLLQKIHKCFMFTIKCYDIQTTITFILYQLRINYKPR